MKMKHIIAGLALLAMPFTAQAEVREAGLVDGFGMSLIYPAVHTKNIAAENAIRTVVFKDGKGYVQAGAGIVNDSVPEKEFMETKNKALAVVNAVKEAARL